MVVRSLQLHFWVRSLQVHFWTRCTRESYAAEAKRCQGRNRDKVWSCFNVKFCLIPYRLLTEISSDRTWTLRPINWENQKIGQPVETLTALPSPDDILPHLFMPFDMYALKDRTGDGISSEKPAEPVRKDSSGTDTAPASPVALDLCSDPSALNLAAATRPVEEGSFARTEHHGAHADKFENAERFNLPKGH